MNRCDANWPSPSNVVAFTTYRNTGFSNPPYHKNNLAFHVGDDQNHVCLNRQQLQFEMVIPNEPIWLEQTHSNLCVKIDEEANRKADAATTRKPQTPLVILTADCLPILICNQEGSEIAAIHAGWRGLVNGIIENTLVQMQTKASSLMAWIGPAICQSCYEVGEEMPHQFQSHYPFSSQHFLRKGEKWQANLAKLAETILNNSNILSVYHSNACTFEQKNDFFSYRRETQTGRMATIIWFNQ